MLHHTGLTSVYICLETMDASIHNSYSYIHNLISILKEDFDVTFIHLDINEKRFQMADEKGYKVLTVPFICSQSEPEIFHHYRNITLLIKDIIPSEQNNIFHLNNINNCFFAFWIRSLLKSKMFLTVHDNYSSTLHNNSTKLKPANPKQNGYLKGAILKSIERTKTFTDICQQVIATSQYTYDYLNLIASNNKSKIIFMPEAFRHSNIYREKMLTLYHSL